MIALLLTFAAWRVCNFIVNESGPGGFMASLRMRVVFSSWTPVLLQDLFTCVECLSVWVCLGAAYAYRLIVGVDIPFVVLWLGMSGMCCLFGRIYNGLLRG